MASTPHPPPLIGKSGNLTVFFTPSAEHESPGSEFSTPPTSPRAEDSPESPPAQTAPPPAPVYSVSTPQLVKMVSPPLPAEKLSRPSLVQVPPLQFGKASAGSDGSLLAFFWDAVARMQEAHASLDEHISRWFGLDQSKYQWALNDYYERTGQVKHSIPARLARHSYIY
uniref:Actin associated protein n=1 Tax=Zea mays TaxID=4577 RepID=B6TTK7_MAIZE|nr:actin associated protein [Zea mays]|eukprot:NP_001150799.1 actin associated protein [Zea mays]